MKIFIMRHGEATMYAASDEERALTDRGRTDSIAAANLCAQKGFNQFDKVLVSPYLRAQQTWQEITSHFSATSVETSSDITPYGQSEQVFDYVSALVDVEKLETVLLVSHLPLVGYLTAEFVPDLAPPMFPTSGIVCIEFDPKTQQGELVWKL
ncbi:phosphohistidine phosphatase SixA [Vibrio sp. 10N.286.49.B3]|uniref:phosphohistidine phosphatase SixA n=1 Tax=Vibrio sp. 10N.286.49.B3 TaxID=1880855 RepID=UPI000C85DF60|nr:phosphohistidine phosphatase SixA [Vibrio sp. 10N.286.49.B3]PMH41826.1 phosphohistidine phosphatase SixA [Vibrio sp. 10N.286.49.B3]